VSAERDAPAEPTIALVCKKSRDPRDKDTVAIVHGSRSAVFKTWRQAGVPHELVHYAVEASYGLQGFVRLTAAGWTDEEILARGGAEAFRAEHLTNAYQYEMWGMAEVSNAAFRRSFETFCGGASAPALGDAEIERGRALLQDLQRRWRALPAGGKLELTLPVAAGGAAARRPEA
jgi:hypothetical protein